MIAGTNTALLPPTFQISIYLQEPFTGAANETCAWGVVSSPDGDVRDCPANNNGHRRPPQRSLGENTTYFHYDNMTEIIEANTLEIKSQNSTSFLQGNASDLVADVQLLASTTGSAS